MFTVLLLSLIGIPLAGGLKIAHWSSAVATLVLGILPSVVLNFVDCSAALVR
ncbi:MAG: hypothetical protein GY953_17425 [bacterium]|nr:hypothetical protein [bacterium]